MKEDIEITRIQKNIPELTDQEGGGTNSGHARMTEGFVIKGFTITQNIKKTDITGIMTEIKTTEINLIHGMTITTGMTHHTITTGKVGKALEKHAMKELIDDIKNIVTGITSIETMVEMMVIESEVTTTIITKELVKQCFVHLSNVLWSR